MTNALAMGILLITSVIIGFRFHTSALNAIAGVGLMLLFGFAFSWFFALVGLLTSTPEAARNGRLHENLVSHSAYEDGHSRRS